MMLLCCTIFIRFIFMLTLCLCYADVFLLFAFDIDKIYDSDDNLPLTYILLQRNIEVNTEDEYT